MILGITAIILSFIGCFIIVPKLIIFLEKIGMVGIDIQKKNRPKIAEMGGPAVLVGFLGGIFFYVWAKVFIYNDPVGLIELLAAISTIIIVSMIGIFDDLSRLFKKHKIDKRYGNVKRIGLKQWQKPLLALPAAVPLMAIMAGDSMMSIPFIGNVDFGIVYPLFFVPIAIVGASNAANMLAGMNGLESGLGSVLLAAMGIYGYLHGEMVVAAIAFCMAAALLGFLRYNWYPAKIMPGDSVVYIIGASIATVAILGNMEKFAVICFIPWFVELILKSRSKMKAENFGKLQPDGTLKTSYKKIYSWTHLIMKSGRWKEHQIVSIIIGIEIVFIIFAYIVSTFF